MSRIHLNRGLELPPVLLHQLQRFDDRRIALAKWFIQASRSLGILNVVFDMDVRDVVVVLGEERNRRHAVTRHEMAKIQVDAVVFRAAMAFSQFSGARKASPPGPAVWP